MVKYITIVIVCLLSNLIEIYSKTIEVCPTCPIRTLQDASKNAVPGDTILLRAGVYTTYNYIANLQGIPNAWITITSAANEEVVFRGQSTAIQFSDPAYLRIERLVFEAQTANGLNIDDGGTYETPAHHIVIENCEWRNINATGNNDLLKLSGVDSFLVRKCIFRNGSPGGSGIDMVGCHFGIIENCRFENQGSNSIQSKGGSSNIIIQKNLFVNGGLRTLNIGGSTGLQFFRPQGINYEASKIYVYSNIFVGSQAPIVFVGAVDCEVVNNTIYKPTKWAIRILQETTEPNFLKCSNNSFINNIVYIDNSAASPTINIGTNTLPETFTFSNNLWFNKDNMNWAGPNLPASETNGIRNVDPLVTENSEYGVSISKSSPVAGRGKEVLNPTEDYFGNLFNSPRSIGAIEINPKTVNNVAKSIVAQFSLYPNPVSDYLEIHFPEYPVNHNSLKIYNVLGECVTSSYVPSNEKHMFIDVKDLPPGIYFVCFNYFIEKIIIQK
ncbi:MAG: right-handed parallel beta-helix repeat-containing protein [Ignavibacteria bacterium]|nr:right-handed parallel beta-helix repeat-containing protein [Ignavibacteria bacterium]